MDPLNWGWLFQKWWESRSVRALCRHHYRRRDATTSIYWMSKWHTREKESPIGKPLSLSSLCHASSPPSSCFSFPLSLLLNCFHGREETDMDRALMSDTGKHFYLFLSPPLLSFTCPVLVLPRCPLLVFMNLFLIESVQQCSLSHCEHLGLCAKSLSFSFILVFLEFF